MKIQCVILSLCSCTAIAGAASTGAGQIPHPSNQDIIDNPQLDPQRPVDLLDRPELRPVVAIRVKTPVRYGVGTGFLISPCHVMTNWHVVDAGYIASQKASSDVELRSVMQRMTYTISGDPKGHWPNTSWVGALQSLARPVAWGAKSGTSGTFNDADGIVFGTYGDWAVLRLDRRLGDTLGWFDVVPVLRERAITLKLTHAGYPGYRYTINPKISMSVPTIPNLMAQDNMSLDSLQKSRLIDWVCADCFGGKGQSGSPLLARGKDGKLRAIAVQWGGTNDTSEGVGFDSRYSPLTLFTPEILRTLQQEHPCDAP